MIRLRWLPANQAWCFLFGRDVATASLLRMDYQLLFPTRREAVDAATRTGFTINTAGDVVWMAAT